MYNTLITKKGHYHFSRFCGTGKILITQRVNETYDTCVNLVILFMYLFCNLKLQGCKTLPGSTG